MIVLLYVLFIVDLVVNISTGSCWYCCCTIWSWLLFCSPHCMVTSLFVIHARWLFSYETGYDDAYAPSHLTTPLPHPLPLQQQQRGSFAQLPGQLPHPQPGQPLPLQPSQQPQVPLGSGLNAQQLFQVRILPMLVTNSAAIHTSATENTAYVI